ncbi:hypothetical protein MWU49_13775 [Alcanivorax sp. S6407]|uniref:hypothetical protein n=1 Tax=Alcanivorax sp. S6407 TaxID=2926424 RepID=UPI001FF54AD7|nr:hypothetical protein [Alcanivorax sp. S6407]MCK0154784.1 hypothetical protein [Alcanivorax sp. S6407]
MIGKKNEIEIRTAPIPESATDQWSMRTQGVLKRRFSFCHKVIFKSSNAVSQKQEFFEGQKITFFRVKMRQGKTAVKETDIKREIDFFKKLMGLKALNKKRHQQGAISI